MTDEQINQLIAEYCKWKPTTDGGICWDANGNAIIAPPNYANDLNAIHEALQTLISTEQQNQYINNIAEVCWADVSRGNNQVVFNQLTSTARQQAEAFLKTIGKWEE